MWRLFYFLLGLLFYSNALALPYIVGDLGLPDNKLIDVEFKCLFVNPYINFVEKIKYGSNFYTVFSPLTCFVSYEGDYFNYYNQYAQKNPILQDIYNFNRMLLLNEYTTKIGNFTVNIQQLMNDLGYYPAFIGNDGWFFKPIKNNSVKYPYFYLQSVNLRDIAKKGIIEPVIYVENIEKAIQKDYQNYLNMQTINSWDMDIIYYGMIKEKIPNFDVILANKIKEIIDIYQQVFNDMGTGIKIVFTNSTITNPNVYFCFNGAYNVSYDTDEYGKAKPDYEAPFIVSGMGKDFCIKAYNPSFPALYVKTDDFIYELKNGFNYEFSIKNNYFRSDVKFEFTIRKDSAKCLYTFSLIHPGIKFKATNNTFLSLYLYTFGLMDFYKYSSNYQRYLNNDCDWYSNTNGTNFCGFPIEQIGTYKPNDLILVHDYDGKFLYTDKIYFANDFANNYLKPIVLTLNNTITIEKFYNSNYYVDIFPSPPFTNEFNTNIKLYWILPELISTEDFGFPNNYFPNINFELNGTIPELQHINIDTSFLNKLNVTSANLTNSTLHIAKITFPLTDYTFDLIFDFKDFLTYFSIINKVIILIATLWGIKYVLE